MSDSFKILERTIRQSQIRHSVLSSNIANVDTPNYRAKDIAFDAVLGSEMGMATTNAKHIQAAPEGALSGQMTGEGSQPWADKNNVEMDLEVAKMTENAMLFEAGITLLTKRVQMYKNALKTGS